MVVVMPAFTVGQETKAGKVRCLHIGPFYPPGTWAGVVTQIGDGPVADYADGDAYTDSPDYPGESADEVERYRRRKLMPPPGSFEKAVKAVFAEVGF